MHRYGLRTVATAMAIVLALGLAIAGLGIAYAQQDNVTDNSPGTPRPGHIHAGSCADLGKIDYALNPATIDNLAEDAKPSAGASFQGADTALPALASTTTVEASLSDILSQPHAINFHMSADDLGTYIACGDLGGFVRDGVLYVGLAPVNGSGFAGTATLTDNGDNTTTVEVMLTELPGSSSYGTPVAAGTAVASSAASASGAASAVESSLPSASELPSLSELPSASVAPSTSELPSASELPSTSVVPSASDVLETPTPAGPVASESALPSTSVGVPSTEPTPSTTG